MCLKSLPLYNSGSVCFTVTNGQPKIGQIHENVFSYRDNKFYSFKVRTIDRYKKIKINDFNLNNIWNNFFHWIYFHSFDVELIKGAINSSNEMPPPPSPAAPETIASNTNSQPALTGSLSKINFFRVWLNE